MGALLVAAFAALNALSLAHMVLIGVGMAAPPTASPHRLAPRLPAAAGRAAPLPVLCAHRPASRARPGHWRLVGAGVRAVGQWG